MRKRYLPEKEQEIGLQITPMINMMFVLLAAFTVVAGQKVVEEAELGVNVPSAAQSSATSDLKSIPITLSILKNGTILYNKQRIASPDDHELGDLLHRLKRAKEADPEQAVIIRPDAEVPHQRVIDVLNAASGANIEKLSFGSA